MPKVLNVGGGPSRELPRVFKGWDQVLLDIDPNVNPDVLCDARKMNSLPASKYDAVHCSHCLEHFHKHEVPQVLGGFTHVLKDNGFVQIAVPDVEALCKAMIGQDISDIWYISPGGPITFHDVMYGWGKQISQGNMHYCHKTAFSRVTLSKALRAARFASVFIASDGYSLDAFAFKVKPSKARLASMGL
jgi:ubiquinone/menaquinone biosynthesis C-methylase UbiE